MLTRKMTLIVTILGILFLAPLGGWADSIRGEELLTGGTAEASYILSDLGGGFWKYDFTLENTSTEPNVLDLYAFSFDFSNTNETIFNSIVSPGFWGAIYDFPSITFISWGLPLGEIGILPGSGNRLSGFSFTVIRDTRLEFIEPFYTNFNVTSVPEPATLLLLGCGLVGAGFLKRRKCFRSMN